MLTKSRHEEIVKLVVAKRSVTVQELADSLHASQSSIRRDLITLDKEGKLTKVFGGAIANEETISGVEYSMAEKANVNANEKRAIAMYAASLIDRFDVVFLDAGTTTGRMVEWIEQKEATYITNSISHGRMLVDKGLKTILVGGEIKSFTDAIVGSEALMNLRKFHFTKCFLGTNGITINNGFTTPDIDEATLKQLVLLNTNPTGRYLLADYDKFGLCSSVSFGAADAAFVITDHAPNEYRGKMIQMKEVLG